MHYSKKNILIGTIIALLIALFYTRVYQPKHTFKTIQAQRGDMHIHIDGVGNVASENIYAISSLYGGTIKDFMLDVGDEVKKAELLARVDYGDLEEQIKQQEALLEKTHIEGETLRNEEETAKTKYAYQSDLYKRNQKVMHSIPTSELLKYENEMLLSRLSVQNIQLKIKSNHALVEQTKSSIKGLRIRMEQYNIHAPTDGYISNKYLSNHQLIAPNQPIVDIIHPQDIIIKAYVDTKISAAVNVGDKAKIMLRSSPIPQEGTVIRIHPSNNAITQEREIDIAPNDTSKRFYLNEQAIVDITPAPLINVVKIPSNSVVSLNNETGVWVVKNDKALFQKIEIIAMDGAFVAIKEHIELPIILPDPNKKELQNGMKIHD